LERDLDLEFDFLRFPLGLFLTGDFDLEGEECLFFSPFFLLSSSCFFLGGVAELELDLDAFLFWNLEGDCTAGFLFRTGLTEAEGDFFFFYYLDLLRLMTGLLERDADLLRLSIFLKLLLTTRGGLAELEGDFRVTLRIGLFDREADFFSF
jgi:hypothetical protein